MSGVTLAAAAALATLSINAASLALGSLGGTGRSLLGVCTADRPVGCDARRRSCVGNALDHAPALGSLSGTGCSLLGVCTADRPVGCDARCRSCAATLSRSTLLILLSAEEQHPYQHEGELLHLVFKWQAWTTPAAYKQPPTHPWGDSNQ